MLGVPRYLIAIDPSLTCSGWALFDVPSHYVIGVGKVRSLSAKLPLGERLLDLQHKVNHVLSLTEIGKNDVLICEAATTMRDPHAAIKVEQVRSLFEVAARARQANVPGRINPRSVQFEVMGLRGKQLERAIVKETATFVASKLYGVRLRELGVGDDPVSLKKNQDIVDALLLGTTALHWITAAARAKQSLAEYFHQPTESRRRFQSFKAA